MTNFNRPQQQKLGVVRTILVGMATPWGFFSTIVYVVFAGFVVSSYQNGTLSEGLATVLALIGAAIWYGLAFRKGRQFVDSLESLPPQREFPRPRNGASGAQQPFGQVHVARAATAAGIGGTAVGVAHMTTPHMDGSGFLRESMVNIDGTPMLNGVDLNGNPYGTTSDMPVPALNVDGTLMPDGIDGLDTNGNSFGTTHDEF